MGIQVCVTTSHPRNLKLLTCSTIAPVMYKGMCVLPSFFSEVNKQLFVLFDDGGIVSCCYTVSTGGAEYPALGAPVEWRRCDCQSGPSVICLWRSPISSCGVWYSSPRVLNFPINLGRLYWMLRWNPQTAFWCSCCYFSGPWGVSGGQQRWHPLWICWL